MNPLNPHKIAGAAAAAIVSFVFSAPSTLHKTAGVALWFVICDTLLGLGCARMSGEMTSSAFRKKLLSKLVCYAGTLALAAGLAVMAGSWAWLIAGWYAVMAAEGISITENLSGMVKTGGPAMAPIALIFDKFSAVLAPKGGSGNGSSTADSTTSPKQ